MPDLQRIAAGSVAVGVIVLGTKYYAYLITGSIALYSDALESIINVVAALAALAAVRLSAIPADKNHPYGHHKAEYFSAVAEGVFIILAAASILREAYSAFLAPGELRAPLQGLIVNGLATLINAGWCAVLIGYGRRHRSPALSADGRHLLTDVISSAGVIGGVLLAVATGWTVLDPLLAVLVALNIIWSGWRLVRQSIAGLMDEAADAFVVERIRMIVSAHAEGAIEAHDLRTRVAGRLTFIDFHLVVAAGMTVADAHDICDRIESSLRQEIEGAAVTIHVEPENKAKHGGIVVI